LNETRVRQVATEFQILLRREATVGYIRLINPSTFDELCAEQRALRDAEESGDPRWRLPK
jgi:hypothetical protein